MHRAKAPDIAQLTVDAPPELIAAIHAAMAVDPAKRPPSFAALGAMLGPATRGSVRTARRLMDEDFGPRRLWRPAKPRVSGTRRVVHATAIAACLALLVAAPIAWRHRREIVWRPGADRTPASQSLAAIAQGKEPRDKAPAKKLNADNRIADNRIAAQRIAAPPAPREPRLEADPEPAAPVELARHIAAAPGNRAARAAYLAPGAKIEPLLLPVDRPRRLSELELSPGQTVRGEGPGRPMILISSEGLRVRRRGVVFENVDFVLEAGEAAESNHGGVVRLEADDAEFRGCSFQVTSSPARYSAATDASAAIVWSAGHAAKPASEASLALPGTLMLDHCVFWNVGAAVDCRARRSIEIRPGGRCMPGLARSRDWRRRQHEITPCFYT